MHRGAPVNECASVVKSVVPTRRVRGLPPAPARSRGGLHVSGATDAAAGARALFYMGCLSTHFPSKPLGAPQAQAHRPPAPKSQTPVPALRRVGRSSQTVARARSLRWTRATPAFGDKLGTQGGADATPQDVLSPAPRRCRGCAFLATQAWHRAGDKGALRPQLVPFPPKPPRPTPRWNTSKLEGTTRARCATRHIR